MFLGPASKRAFFRHSGQHLNEIKQRHQTGHYPPFDYDANRAYAANLNFYC